MAFKLSRVTVKLPKWIRLPPLSNTLLWRLGLGALILLCLTLLGMVWISGLYDTQRAMDDGRRLLIKVEDGSIEGKQITLENDKPKPANTASASPPDSTAPASTATAAPPVSSGNPAPVPVAPTAAPAAPENPAPIPVASTAAPAPPENAAPAPAAESPTQVPVPSTTPLPALENTESSRALLDNSGPVTPAAVPLAALNPALAEKSSVGMLPIIGPDGVKPWRYYSKPYERKGSLPMIAVIVTGLGQNKTATDGAIRLPENFTLSFLPYVRDVTSWVNSARIAGHEIMMDLPLEPSNYPASDPGPYGLLISKGTHENASRLQWLMARVQGYIGFVTPQNEVFSSNEEALKALLQSLSNRGLMLAFGHDPAKSEIKQIIETTQTANIVGDVLLDEELSTTSIQARFISLERIASKRGYAIGIAQAFPITIQQLNTWSAKLEERGFVLVPVTFLTKLKFS